MEHGYGTSKLRFRAITAGYIGDRKSNRENETNTAIYIVERARVQTIGNVTVWSYASRQLAQQESPVLNDDSMLVSALDNEQAIMIAKHYWKVCG